MILWTIQVEAAWRKLRSCGVLQGSADLIMEKTWQGPYDWMVQKMGHRIGPAPSKNTYPLWAWFQWKNRRQAKPDLRSSGHLSKGEFGVRIEFECPDNTVLLSDFDLWHYVLNYWYIPETKIEGDCFETELNKHGLSFFDTKPLPNQKYHKRIVRSWDKIFDLDWHERTIALPKSKKSIQATLWELTIEQVRSVRHFKSR
jgi:hypothetical protein